MGNELQDALTGFLPVNPPPPPVVCLVREGPGSLETVKTLAGNSVRGEPFPFPLLALVSGDVHAEAGRPTRAVLTFCPARSIRAVDAKLQPLPLVNPSEEIDLSAADLMAAGWRAVTLDGAKEFMAGGPTDAFHSPVPIPGGPEQIEGTLELP